MLIAGDKRGHVRKDTQRLIRFFIYIAVLHNCYRHVFLRHTQPLPWQEDFSKWKMSIFFFCGNHLGYFLSHVPDMKCPCQAVAATVGTGLAGRALCNLIIASLGPPQEMWPSVAEVCQVSNPVEWVLSLNRQILKWLEKPSEIIHHINNLVLPSFPVELCSYNLRKQKLG